jgi:anti-sigma factor RsiW
VLVYRYRKHVIDVYVFPDQGAAAAQPTSTVLKDGYALARWHDAGMVWCAVTDAEPNALASFRTALDAQLQGAHE